MLYKGYHCLDPITKKVYILRHVVFNEKVLPFKSHSSSSNFDLLDSLLLTTCPNTDEYTKPMVF